MILISRLLQKTSLMNMEDFWATVIFQLYSLTLLLANRRNDPRVKAGISVLSQQLMRNPENTTAVTIYPRTQNLRRAIGHQELRGRKNVLLIHHILMLRWKLEKASISQSISIRRKTGQSHLIQMLRLMKIQGGI
uniref:Uncharacterized protein n=1 Tax=Arundo donax TaxID=35708 RepID=A0A0A9CX25_ARUDO